MALATLTTKGQITIPKAIRDSLKINTGDKIEIVVTDKGEALIRPVTKKVDEVFSKLHRAGGKAVSLETMNNEIRRRMKDKFK